MINVYGCPIWARNVQTAVSKTAIARGCEAAIMLRIEDSNTPSTTMANNRTQNASNSNNKHSNGGNNDQSISIAPAPLVDLPLSQTMCDIDSTDSNYIILLSKQKNHAREIATAVVKDGSCKFVILKK
jgi:hypothetical protein